MVGLVGVVVVRGVGWRVGSGVVGAGLRGVAVAEGAVARRQARLLPVQRTGPSQRWPTTMAVALVPPTGLADVAEGVVRLWAVAGAERIGR